MNNNNLNVSIIIVNYNTKKLLADCLNSIYEHTKDVSFEVIVSDNGSIDGSIEMLKIDFPQVILLENNENLGFGVANNRGLAIAKGKYIFYLNSDTILLNNSIKMFFDYWEENGEKENIGALGCNLQDRNGNIVHSWAKFPDYKYDITGLYHNVYGFLKLAIQHFSLKKQIPEYKNTNSLEKYIGQTDYIVGADLFLLNNADAYFDEDFFMYCEETYLQYNLYKKCKSRLLIDGPEIIHLEGASSKKITSDIIHKEASFSSIENKISKVIYFKKTGVSTFKILIMKLLIILLWLNPMLIKSNKKYIKKLLFARSTKCQKSQ